MDIWIKERIGIEGDKIFTRKLLEEYQFRKLIETLNWAKEKSKFYKKKLQDISVENIEVLSDVKKLPFTSAEELKREGHRMICVPQEDINRIVTLTSSGSEGVPKRVYFTKEDQELTIGYFEYGMQNLIDKRDTVLILLPFEREGSVGDLLKKALLRVGSKVIPYGLIPREDNALDEKVLNIIKNEKVTSIVGGPVEIARLAYNYREKLNIDSVNSVLLSTEYVSAQNRNLIEKSWNCQVFEHYGMTEMGLGGAVSCKVREGYHLREEDLFFEIIDSKTGEPIVGSSWGEVVFTTLTRVGMPLIRYRTGDISRWIEQPCSCGSILRRFDRVRERGARKARI